MHSHTINVDVSDHSRAALRLAAGCSGELAGQPG